jgi:Fe-S-cluster containining protein
MTECARCGDCCDPVVFMLTRGDLTRRLAEQYLAGEARRNLVFIDEHWHTIAVHDGGRFSTLRCDMFDAESRLCTAHAQRPPICSGFPWYGEAPRPTLMLSPRCSFNADVRTMLPIVAVT